MNKTLRYESSDIAHHVSKRGVKEHSANRLMKQLRRTKGRNNEKGAKKARY
jgi:hypothetical protein